MLAFALGSLAKGTLLLCLGILADRLWRRRGPDVRHAVLALALIGALVVPVLSMLLPTWRASVPWLPATSVRMVEPNDNVVRRALQAAQPATTGAPSDARATSGSAPAAPESSFLLLGVFVWAAGALGVFAFLVCGEVGLLRVRRRSRRLDAPSWTRLVRQAATA
ncbi:MAG: hypothetical protein ACREOG_09310, partial [Gemmatimonadaceae bacterium]